MINGLRNIKLRMFWVEMLSVCLHDSVTTCCKLHSYAACNNNS